MNLQLNYLEELKDEFYDDVCGASLASSLLVSEEALLKKGIKLNGHIPILFAVCPRKLVPSNPTTEVITNHFKRSIFFTHSVSIHARKCTM
ncbi:hypothetical protein Y032_0417g1099 [Ancylostoma ceylanicum]|uniref:Uncharacterized protein n=1 Tax=Ancylostoma ceylanicum TaxID=53326 RepID=A0A016X1N2_9BILA|nr:hypothetical protein Y032_0417g1099 [Ancylostoma ceylanicum]